MIKRSKKYWAELELADMTKPTSAVSHHVKEIAELRGGRELGAEYLNATMKLREPRKI
jgi:hypothetical protein